MGALVLTRKKNESIVVSLPTGESMVITVFETRGHEVRIGIEGDQRTFKVLRAELYGEKQSGATERDPREDRQGHGEDAASPEELLSDPEP